MAYKYKINPVTGKMDLVNEVGKGEFISNITSTDKTLKVVTDGENVDITAPAVKMLEGYRCGVGTGGGTFPAKFCDLYWSHSNRCISHLPYFHCEYHYFENKAAGGNESIIYTADLCLIFGNTINREVCNAIILNECAYSDTEVSADLINKYKISNLIKVDFIAHATAEGQYYGDPRTDPDSGLGHAVVFVTGLDSRGGNIHLHPVSSLSIMENNSNYCFFYLNPEVVTGKCTSYTTQGTIQGTKLADKDEIQQPIVYKGTLGTNGDITSLPSASEGNHGWQYKVITAGIYNGYSANVGDSFISNGASWGYYPTETEILTPDELDLTRGADNKIRFKDRLPENGMGNIHVKTSLATATSLGNQEDTEYRLTEDSTISHHIVIKKNCVVNFDGAKITSLEGTNFRFMGETIPNSSDRHMVRYKGKSVIRNVGLMPFQSSSIDDDLGFYNVTKYGIENNGVVDVTEKLQELIDKIRNDMASSPSSTSDTKSRRKADIYFPPGYYRITNTILPSWYNMVIKGENRSSVIIFAPTENDKTAFGTKIVDSTNSPKGFSFDGICITANTYSQTRKKISNVGQWWNGSNAQHYQYTSKNNQSGTNGILLRGSINNCEIVGFDGIGVITDEMFCHISNSTISHCNIGFSNSNSDSYTADSLVDNSEIRYCGTGAIVSHWSYFRNCWLDEFIHNAIWGSGSLVMSGTHINHCDEAGICSDNSGGGWRIMGDFVINRTNCYYAGYVLENIPSDELYRACAIYSKGNLTINSSISISNQEMADASDGDAENSGKCCVIPVFCASNVNSGSRLSIIGGTNTDIPILGNAEDDNLYIETARGRWNVRIQRYESKMSEGSIIDRPNLLAGRKGFTYYDTTLRQSILWDGYNWMLTNAKAPNPIFVLKGERVGMYNSTRAIFVNYDIANNKPAVYKSYLCVLYVNEQLVPIVESSAFYLTAKSNATPNYRVNIKIIDGIAITNKPIDILTASGKTIDDIYDGAADSNPRIAFFPSTSETILPTDKVRLDVYELDNNIFFYRPDLSEDNVGFQYFDTTLGKPIFWIGTKWVDSTGADA